MDLSVTCEQKLCGVGGLRVWYLNQICRLFSNSKSINKVTSLPSQHTEVYKAKLLHRLE